MEIKIIKQTTVNVDINECIEYIADGVNIEIERGINNYLYDVTASADCDIDDINDITRDMIDKEVVKKIIKNLCTTYDIVL